MNIEYLREFLLLSETENFWEASNRLYIGQSTLSKHIQSMEKELNHILFDRNNKSVKLSEYGKAFLPHAKLIVQEFYDSISDMNNIDASKNDRLIFGGIPILPQYHITNIFSEFYNQMHNSNALIFDGDSTTLKEKLRKKECEIILIRETDNNNLYKEFVYLPYLTDEFVVMLPSNHPLSCKETVKLSELRDEKFLIVGEEPEIRDKFINACNIIGFTPNIILDCKRLSVLLDMVTLGQGVSVIPSGYLKLSDKQLLPSDPPFKICKLTPSISTKLYFCHRKNDTLSDSAKFFLKIVKKYTEDTKI